MTNQMNAEAPWMQRPQPVDPNQHIKELVNEAQTWQPPNPGRFDYPPQQSQPPTQQQQGWVQTPNGQWIQPGPWLGNSPVQRPPQQPPQYPVHVQQQPVQSQWGAPPPGWYQLPNGQWVGPQQQQMPMQQPVQPRPVQAMPQQPASRLPPAGTPPKEGAVPVSKKQKRLIYVALTIAVICTLMAIAAGVYFVMTY